MDRRSFTVLLLLAATWGSSYLFIAVALEDLGPSVITFLRLALGAAVVVAMAARERVLSRLRGRLRAVTALGVVQLGAPLLLIAVGEQDIPSALAGTLVAATPVFSALITRGASTPVQLAGVAVGFVGVALLLGLDATAAGDGGLKGALLVVLAALGYAVGAAWLARSFADLPRLATLSGTMTTSALLLLPLALLDLPTRAPDVETVASVAALGVLGTGVAFVLFYRLVATVGPTKSLLVTYLAPVFAVGYGALLLDERIVASTATGLGLVLGGAYLAGARPTRTSRTQDATTSVSSSTSS
ncbi:MAG: EamA family transporter [Mycobacteriales bacterium]|nr:EamA family transporter [Mycobacteriales bacterium]